MTAWTLHPRGLDGHGLADGQYGVEVTDGVVTGWSPVIPNPTTTREEVLMASGVSFPAEAVESSAGGDWLYGEVPS
jgi:hypothetical protein